MKLSYVNTFARIESLCTFRVGFRSLMESISFTKQSNLFLHFFRTLKRLRRSFGTSLCIFSIQTLPRTIVRVRCLLSLVIVEFNLQIADTCTHWIPIFSFVIFSNPPRSLFSLNHVRKVQERCSHSRFSFQAIILEFFDRNVGLCCSCFLVAMGDRGYLR